MVTRTLSLAVVAVALSACGLDNFHVEYEDDTTIPGSPVGSVLEFAPFGGAFDGVDLLSDQKLRDEGVSADNLDSARVEVLELSVTAGSSFETWLDDVAFYVEAEGLPRKLVAEKHGIRQLPAGTILLDLDCTRVELKPYVAKPMTITAEATGRPPVEDTQIHARVVVDVDADVSSFLGL